jgi:hypothetical protein
VGKQLPGRLGAAKRLWRRVLLVEKIIVVKVA